MNKICFLLFSALFFTLNLAHAQGCMPNGYEESKMATNSLANKTVQPYTYTDNFKDRDLGAWASYPNWQDLTYDQGFRVNKMILGYPNISIVQNVIPY